LCGVRIRLAKASKNDYEKYFVIKFFRVNIDTRAKLVISATKISLDVINFRDLKIDYVIKEI